VNPGEEWREAQVCGSLEKMAQKFLGASPRRWLEYLTAILLGNGIYYFSLLPHLPGILQHQGFQADFGLLIDFLVCAGVFALIQLGIRISK
jgi:hypothetical protein